VSVRRKSKHCLIVSGNTGSGVNEIEPLTDILTELSVAHVIVWSVFQCVAHNCMK